jgi:hypothetical protein
LILRLKPEATRRQKLCAHVGIALSEHHDPKQANQHHCHAQRAHHPVRPGRCRFGRAMTFHDFDERGIAERVALTVVRDRPSVADRIEHGLLASLADNQIRPTQAQGTAMVKVRRSDGRYAWIVPPDSLFELNQRRFRSWISV